MPTVGDQTAVDTLLRCFFVGVIGDRHVALAEIEDFFFADSEGAEFVHSTWDVVFKVAVAG